MKEGVNMAAMYFKLVLAHKRTCNENNAAVKQVPSNIKDEVLEMLFSKGYDADGNKI